MPPYADIYVLTKSRTETVVAAFLERFAPAREEMTDEYLIPQFAEAPRTVFTTSAEVIRYCCSHTSEPQSVYWRLLGDEDPAYAMVFFTSDAQLILGLSVNEEAADRFLAELRSHAGSDIGYITFENPPPGTATEFCKIAREASA